MDKEEKKKYNAEYRIKNAEAIKKQTAGFRKKNAEKIRDKRYDDHYKPNGANDSLELTQQCAECRFKTHSVHGLSLHIKTTHNKSPEEYYNIHVKHSESEGLCIKCGSKTMFIGMNKGFRRTCSKECSNEAFKLTCLAKYGVENPNHLRSVRDKAEATSFAKYGVSNPLKNDDVRRKVEKTNITRYGTKNVFGSDVIRDRIKDSLIERYGVSSPNSEDMKAKRRATMVERYGVEYPAQNQDLFPNSFGGAVSRKRYETTFGNTIIVQGSYEKKFVAFCEENQFSIENGPALLYCFDGKHHKYFPDFKVTIGSVVHLVEMKSTYWYLKFKEVTDIKNEVARQFCNDMGWRFHFIINDIDSKERIINKDKFQVLLSD